MNLEIAFLEHAQGDEYERVLLVGDHRAAGEAVASVEITDGIRNVLRIDIAEACESRCFQDARVIGNKAFIGFGGRVIVIDVLTHHVTTHAVDGYFGHFFDAEELDYSIDDFALLAGSASELLAFDLNGELLWKTSQLGIDGVLVHKVSPTRIEGSGEWDPPGGWRPFVLTPTTGERG